MRLRRAIRATLVVAVLVGVLVVLGPVLIPERGPDVVVTAEDCVRQWNEAPPVEMIDAELVLIQPYDGWNNAVDPAACWVAWMAEDDQVASFWAPAGGFPGRGTMPADVPRWDRLRDSGEELEGVHASPRDGNRLTVSGNLDWKETYLSEPID